MATIKSFTSLEQSKKLAEILPLESADMCYLQENGQAKTISPLKLSEILNVSKPQVIPCWSLAALLEILDYPQLSKDKLGRGKVGWMVSVYPNECRYDSCWYDNPVDACYEIIIKLNESKML